MEKVNKILRILIINNNIYKFKPTYTTLSLNKDNREPIHIYHEDKVIYNPYVFDKDEISRRAMAFINNDEIVFVYRDKGSYYAIINAVLLEKFEKSNFVVAMNDNFEVKKIRCKIGIFKDNEALLTDYAMKKYKGYIILTGKLNNSKYVKFIISPTWNIYGLYGYQNSIDKIRALIDKEALYQLIPNDGWKYQAVLEEINLK